MSEEHICPHCNQICTGCGYNDSAHCQHCTTNEPIQDFVKQTEGYRLQIDTLTRQLAEREKKIEGLEKYYASIYEQQLVEKDAEIARYSHNEQELVKAVVDSNRQIQQLQNEIKSLKQRPDSFWDKKLSKYRQQIPALNQQIQQLQTQLATAQKDNVILHNRLNELASEDMKKKGFEQALKENKDVRRKK